MTWPRMLEDSRIHLGCVAVSSLKVVSELRRERRASWLPPHQEQGGGPRLGVLVMFPSSVIAPGAGIPPIHLSGTRQHSRM